MIKKISLNYETNQEREAKLRNINFSLLLRKITEERIFPLLDRMELEELAKRSKKENTEMLYGLLFGEEFKEERKVEEKKEEERKEEGRKEERKKAIRIEDLIE